MLCSCGGEVGRARATEALFMPETDRADDFEFFGGAAEQDRDGRSEGNVVVRRRARVDGDVVCTHWGVAAQQTDVTTQLHVTGHRVSHRRGSARRDDGLAVRVGDQGVSTVDTLGNSDAWNMPDAGKNVGRDRRAAYGGPRCRGVRRLVPDDGVLAGR